MALDQIDILIIGSGIIGAAVASLLSDEGKSVWVVEKHSRIGEGITSRNSGVIHSGLYYPPQSHKARLCVRGKKLTYEWAIKHHVPFWQFGKLVIAVEKDEMSDLEWLYTNAKASGATGISLLTQSEIKTKEPIIKAYGGLFASETGVIDQFAFTKSLLRNAESRGTIVLTNVEVLDAKAKGMGFQVKTNRGGIHTQVVVNASGLESDRIGGLMGKGVPTIYPCRGDYFYLRPAPKINHLIYPIKKKSSPGLGIHVTLGLDGSVRLGPDAEYVEARDDFSSRPVKSEIFRRAVERYLGPLPQDSLHYDQCGIRPKLRLPQELEEKDFFIRQSLPGWIDLVGIESPGLTAALAIAEEVKTLL